LHGDLLRKVNIRQWDVDEKVTIATSRREILSVQSNWIPVQSEGISDLSEVGTCKENIFRKKINWMRFLVALNLANTPSEAEQVLPLLPFSAFPSGVHLAVVSTRWPSKDNVISLKREKARELFLYRTWIFNIFNIFMLCQHICKCRRCKLQIFEPISFQLFSFVSCEDFSAHILQL
jgi:hypothetical protein